MGTIGTIKMVYVHSDTDAQFAKRKLSVKQNVIVKIFNNCLLKK